PALVFCPATARLLDLGLCSRGGAFESALRLAFTLGDPGFVEALRLRVGVDFLPLANLQCHESADGQDDQQRQDQVDGAHDSTSSASGRVVSREPLPAAMLSITLFLMSSTRSARVVSNSTSFSLP